MICKQKVAFKKLSSINQKPLGSQPVLMRAFEGGGGFKHKKYTLIQSIFALIHLLFPIQDKRDILDFFIIITKWQFYAMKFREVFS